MWSLNINCEFEYHKLNLLHTTLVICVNTNKEITDDNSWATKCGGLVRPHTPHTHKCATRNHWFKPIKRKTPSSDRFPSPYAILLWPFCNIKGTGCHALIPTHSFGSLREWLNGRQWVRILSMYRVFQNWCPITSLVLLLLSNI